MKRLALVLAGLMYLALPVSAADLTGLLDEAKDAAYSAEQLVVCDTPDGVRDALIRLEQRGGEIRYGDYDGDSGIWTGFGGWVGPGGSTAIQSDDAIGLSATAGIQETSYELTDGEPTTYLGREATRYRLESGDVLRAGLVVDDETGVFLRLITYDIEGDRYCERRFVSFDPSAPVWDFTQSGESQVLESDEGDDFPSELAGFDLVDHFSDESNISFAYYSDGFFSFAVFRSPVVIEAVESIQAEIDGNSYGREYTPGQVTYTWPVGDGGMALIGDLPPDMHPAVLAGLDSPATPGFFQRIWRNLFG